jgi:type IV pilus assembly protein PilE
MTDLEIKHRGFSLIELMIVVVIIGVLTLVAFPSYQEHVKKGKRAEGQAAVLQAAQALERFMTTNNTYTTDLAAAGYKAYSGAQEASSAYALTVAAAPGGNIASSFFVTATPAATWSDPECNQFTIDHTGAKGVQGGTWNASQCWK